MGLGGLEYLILIPLVLPSPTGGRLILRAGREGVGASERTKNILDVEKKDKLKKKHRFGKKKLKSVKTFV